MNRNRIVRKRADIRVIAMPAMHRYANSSAFIERTFLSRGFLDTVKAFCLCLIILPGALAALPLEIGFTGYGGLRSKGQFDRGLDQFRTSLSPSVLSATRHSPFRSIPSGEGWIRITDVISENSSFGLFFGRLYTPDISIRQTRSDLVYFQGSMDFMIPYFGFSYYYRNRPVNARSFSWEIGGSLGFLTEPRWRMSGLYQSQFQTSRLNSSHRATYGSMLRLEAAALRGIGGHLYLRAGVSQSFMYAGRFQGIVNSSNGYWVRLQNGGLFALSPSQFTQTFAVSNEPLLAGTQVSLIRDRADLPISLTQAFIGVGIRF